MAYYANQRTGSSPHSPAVCIPGNGWMITDLERTHYTSQDSSVSLPFNRVVIGRGSDKQLVYYWFEERGMKIANEYWSKLYLLRDALVRKPDRRRAGAADDADLSRRDRSRRRQAAAGFHAHRRCQPCALSAGAPPMPQSAINSLKRQSQR